MASARLFRLDGFAAGKVGNGARHLEYAVVGTGRERQTLHRHAEHTDALVVRLGILMNHAFRHLRIAVYALVVLVAFLLQVACLDDTLANDAARFTLGSL